MHITELEIKFIDWPKEQVMIVSKLKTPSNLYTLNYFQDFFLDLDHAQLSYDRPLV